jgi:hypothetical protein
LWQNPSGFTDSRSAGILPQFSGKNFGSENIHAKILKTGQTKNLTAFSFFKVINNV